MMFVLQGAVEMAEQQPIIDLRNISLKLDSRLVLDNVSWNIRAGEHWVLYGPNGSGKTRLLEILMGYRLPTTGQIIRFGEVLPDLRELRKQIGYLGASVYQLQDDYESALGVVLSGAYGTIGLYAEPDRREIQRARDLLALCGASALEKRSFGTFSQGEKARVMIARALMSNPSLLVLDEPTAAVDLRGREEFLESISAACLQNSELTVLLVTHYTEEITGLFTQAALIKDGRFICQGSLKSVFSESHLSELFGIPIRLVMENGRILSWAGQAKA